MEVKDAKHLDEYSREYFRLVMTIELSSDLMTKVTYLSKLPNNIGDLVLKDLEEKGKSLQTIYWVDIINHCKQKLKYLYWQKNAQEIATKPSQECCKELLPWTPIRKKHHKKRRYGKYKVRRVANPKKPFPKYRYFKRRNALVKSGCCFICKRKGILLLNVQKTHRQN